MLSTPNQHRYAQRSTKLSQKLVVLEEPLYELPPSAYQSPVDDDAPPESLKTPLQVVVSTSRVSAYCTAREFKFDKLFSFMNIDSSYVRRFDECIYYRQISSPIVYLDTLNENHTIDEFDHHHNNFSIPIFKEAFYMNYGAVVLWGYSEEEEKDILRALGPFEVDKIPVDDVEADYLQCAYDNQRTPRIHQDVIFLNSQENFMQKVAISMALGQSVKLGYYEFVIDITMDQLKHVPADIAKGKAKMTQKDCLKVIGQLYDLKKNVILSTSILDTPEMFWFERQVSPLYEATRLYMEITHRVKILDQKVLVISDMLDMLNESVTNHQALYWPHSRFIFISNTFYLETISLINIIIYMEFYVNGVIQTLSNPRPELTLLQYLRSIGLTGTKLGCAEGGCGACTVLVSHYDKITSKIIHKSVNACLAPLCSVQDKHVITIEGLGNSKNPHPTQERIAAYFGSQCGFCTPGIVMSLYALLRNNPTPSSPEVEEAFDGMISVKLTVKSVGNLCRCTGYRPILDAAKTFCPMGDACCKNNPETAPMVAKTAELKKYDPSQELIFPPALINKLKNEELKEALFESSVCSWYRPVELEQLLQYKAQYSSESKIVCGNTEVGIETKFKNQVYKRLIYPMEISELSQVQDMENGVKFGACLTLTDFARELGRIIMKYGKERTRTFQALLDNLKWFAGNQIRNVATIAGNIVTASPISDLNPIFVASMAVVDVQESGKPVREIKMSEFFLGYRKTALKTAEVMLSIFIPFTRSKEYIVAYKQAKRRDDDIAIVTCGLRVYLNDENKVQDCSFAFGGMGATTLEAKEANKLATGKMWDESLLQSIISTLTNFDLFLSASAPGGMVEYRRALAASLFFKFYNHVLYETGVNSETIGGQKSRPVSEGMQILSQSTGEVAVGKVTVHTTALKQVTGEAVYTDDVRHISGELYASPVLSSKAHAKLKAIDASQALKFEGVVAFISANDVPGSNVIGPVFKDEELFATDTVYFAGQLIGLVIGKDQFHTQKAAKCVRIEYEELPAILTIEQAIDKHSFYAIRKEMKRGDLEEGFSKADHVIEGEIRVGGQNHFYLETQASIAIPKWEGDEIEIIASTQNPTETQHLVGHVLGIPSNKVVCRVKRMGGGFGGKETRSAPLSCALAVAAKKLNAPIRCMLDRDEDMVMCGQRHPFLGKYKVGFTKQGKILALEQLLYSNAGYSADLSIAVMERAVSHSDNVYFIPNIRVFGTVCKTNIHSNTAFRGFGGPQGMLITETWINHVAEYLNKPVHQIQEMNMYHENQLTHFNQPLDNFHIPRLWKEIMQSSDFVKRKSLVDKFNANQKYKKRGISILPTKFGIAFTARFLNQAGALVHVYSDGSVLVSHAGTEMGQGLHTKMIQIAADVFQIPISQVHISETSTDKVPNTPPTAASAGADLNGMAVLDACQKIMKRLQPYKEEFPNRSFSSWADMAYKDRVSLSATGFYKTPDLSYDWSTNSGRLFNYFTFGVAVSEVEVDTLTGDFQILQSDILMDLGESMNPGIDIGQIEGAFIQGAGWSTIEETVFFPNGQLFTRGPGNYKIPGFTDIPLKFNIKLLSESKNTRAVHSSKAVGEPPLFLGSSVYFAIRDAIKAKREMEGLKGYVRLDAPATPERIRMACEDQFTKLAKSIARKKEEKDWCIRV